LNKKAQEREKHNNLQAVKGDSKEAMNPSRKKKWDLGRRKEL